MAERQYFLNQNGEEVGPFTRSDVRDLDRRGRIDESDLVRRDGSSEWRPVVIAIAQWSEQERGPDADAQSAKWLVLTPIIVVLLAFLGMLGWRVCQALRGASPMHEVTFAQELDQWIDVNLPDVEAEIVRLGRAQMHPQKPGHYREEVAIRVQKRSRGVEVREYEFEFDTAGQITAARQR